MNELNGYDVEDLTRGQRATSSKTITEADISQSPACRATTTRST